MNKKNLKYIIFGIIALITIYISWKVGFFESKMTFIENLKEKYNPFK